jgi:hypothetical protein
MDAKILRKSMKLGVFFLRAGSIPDPCERVKEGIAKVIQRKILGRYFGGVRNTISRISVMSSMA